MHFHNTMDQRYALVCRSMLGLQGSGCLQLLSPRLPRGEKMGRDLCASAMGWWEPEMSPASQFICLALLCCHPAGVGEKVPLTGFPEPRQAVSLLPVPMCVHVCKGTYWAIRPSCVPAGDQRMSLNVAPQLWSRSPFILLR